MRWKSTVAYDGTDFEGWQSQPKGRSIQDFIERRLTTLFYKKIRIHSCSRTDSGVHAKGHVFHFDGEWNHSPKELLRALRTGYPDTIQVYKIERVDSDFHARYSSIGKAYYYRLYEGYASPFETRYTWSLGNRKLDTELMNQAAGFLIGEHDFTSFAANSGTEEESLVKDLRHLSVERKENSITIKTEASGYAYKMVRSIVGCLVDVGVGKLQPQDVKLILEEKKRTNKVLTAPPQGLFLEKVFYPE